MLDVVQCRDVPLCPPDGQIALLTNVFAGQEATVLQLPAQPVSAAEVEAQERVPHVG
jgi:hypothetical protein